jgi:hypothetical protein
MPSYDRLTGRSACAPLPALHRALLRLPILLLPSWLKGSLLLHYLQVTVDKDVLRISVEKSEEKKDEKEEQGRKWHRWVLTWRADLAE